MQKCISMNPLVASGLPRPHSATWVSSAGVPPALVVVGEYDIVHDEGLKYADKLAAANVPVTIKDYTGVGHNFPSHSVAAEKQGLRIHKGEAAIRDIVAFIQKAMQ